MTKEIPDFVKNSVSWNPWHGCRKVSEGCLNCYVYSGDKSRGIEGSDVVRRSKTQFDLPLKKDRSGRYKYRDVIMIASLTSDFFIEEADQWRDEAWEIIRKRKDLTFELVTKRPERIRECLPSDWGNGYPNVMLAVSTENQRTWELRVPILCSVPAARHDIYMAPMIERIECDELLDRYPVDAIFLGGEICPNARVCDFQWVVDVRESCVRHNVMFHWRNCGTNLLKNGELYRNIPMEAQDSICASANLDYVIEDKLPKDKQTKLFDWV